MKLDDKIALRKYIIILFIFLVFINVEEVKADGHTSDTNNNKDVIESANIDGVEHPTVKKLTKPSNVDMDANKYFKYYHFENDGSTNPYKDKGNIITLHRFYDFNNFRTANNDQLISGNNSGGTSENYTLDDNRKINFIEDDYNEKWRIIDVKSNGKWEIKKIEDVIFVKDDDANQKDEAGKEEYIDINDDILPGKIIPEHLKSFYCIKSKGWIYLSPKEKAQIYTKNEGGAKYNYIINDPSNDILITESNKTDIKKEKLFKIVRREIEKVDDDKMYFRNGGFEFFTETDYPIRSEVEHNADNLLFIRNDLYLINGIHCHYYTYKEYTHTFDTMIMQALHVDDHTNNVEGNFYYLDENYSYTFNNGVTINFMHDEAEEIKYFKYKENEITSVKRRIPGYFGKKEIELYYGQDAWFPNHYQKVKAGRNFDLYKSLLTSEELNNLKEKEGEGSIGFNNDPGKYNFNVILAEKEFKHVPFFYKDFANTISALRIKDNSLNNHKDGKLFTDHGGIYPIVDVNGNDWYNFRTDNNIKGDGVINREHTFEKMYFTLPVISSNSSFNKSKFYLNSNVYNIEENQSDKQADWENNYNEFYRSLLADDVKKKPYCLAGNFRYTLDENCNPQTFTFFTADWFSRMGEPFNLSHVTPSRRVKNDNQIIRYENAFDKALAEGNKEAIEKYDMFLGIFYYLTPETEKYCIKQGMSLEKMDQKMYYFDEKGNIKVNPENPKKKLLDHIFHNFTVHSMGVYDGFGMISFNHSGGYYYSYDLPLIKERDMGDLRIGNPDDVKGDLGGTKPAQDSPDNNVSDTGKKLAKDNRFNAKVYTFDKETNEWKALDPEKDTIYTNKDYVLHFYSGVEKETVADSLMNYTVPKVSFTYNQDKSKKLNVFEFKNYAEAETLNKNYTKINFKDFEVDKPKTDLTPFTYRHTNIDKNIPEGNKIKRLNNSQRIISGNGQGTEANPSNQQFGFYNSDPNVTIDKDDKDHKYNNEILNSKELCVNELLFRINDDEVAEKLASSGDSKLRIICDVNKKDSDISNNIESLLFTFGVLKNDVNAIDEKLREGEAKA